MLTRFIIYGSVLIAAYFALIFEPSNSVGLPSAKKTNDPLAERVISLIGIADSEHFHEKTDAIRKFVHRSSVHRIDDELYEYLHDSDRILAMLEASHLGKEEQPHLECWTRSNAMIRLAHSIGVRSRQVIVYRPIDGYLSHTLLEVHNPETDTWEIQDPEYDMFYVDPGKTTRASITDLVMSPFDAFMPCSDENTCGWDISSKEQHDPKVLYDYFGLATFADGETAIVLVNDDRFPFSESFMLDGRRIKFCEIRPALCAEGKIVRGSWGAN
jgi:hypothetical protein